MTRFQLRPAAAADFKKIKSLVREARINPTGLDWQRFIVAENDHGVVIGCVQIKPHRDGSHELASLVVDPEFRGQGIARALVEGLLENHTGELYLMCRSSLGGFYEKLGFAAVDETQMPPYFRRVSRLASLAKILAREGDELLVMKGGKS
jgi:N-acetylglutamate synthase-like GNAT family acetyltransferase